MKKFVVLLLSLALVFSCAVFVFTAEAEGSCPQITFLTPIAGGFKINFTACENAASYEVFSKTDGEWASLGTTQDTFFACQNLVDGTAYTFTVKGLDDAGAYLADFDAEGFTQTYYNPPALRSLTCTANGLKLTWNKIPAIEYYSVYRKTAGQAWELLAVTDRAEYIDTTVTSGKAYAYTVKGVAENGTLNLTYHDTKGIARTFVAMPKITSFKNLADGTQITWSNCAGAGAYRVFLKTAGGWKKLADTAALTYTHKGLKNNTSYIYTVRAIDKAGNFVSAYNSDGSENTFYTVPKLTGATSAYGGMKVSWNAVPGVGEYLVFVKTASGWEKAGVSKTNSFTDKNAVSGKTYTYTVKCSENGGKRALSWHNAKGVSGTYVAAPKIIGFENENGSIKITAAKSAGAYAYRFFAKTAKGWKAIATTTALSATHKGVKNNTKYIYTVRAVDKKGNYISAYNDNGWATRYFAPPAITAVKLSGTGNVIRWEENAFIASYRVYKKNFGGSWAVLGESDTNTFTDKTVKKNELYTYTLRYLSKAGKPISAYLANTKYYFNGAVANGKINYGGKTLGFTDGYILQGLVKRDGKYYFYNSAGFLQKNGIVGNSKVGYFYADKNGVIDLTLRDAVTSGGKQWLVLDGKVKQVTTEDDKTLFRAFELLRECTDKSMTKEEKLYAAFRYLQKIVTEKNPRIPHYTGNDWYLIYANDIFLNRVGNCMSYGAAFAFMAKAIGYDEAYACNSGGHGWAEINHLVYDPEWDIHHKNSFYGISYDVNCGNDYKGAISAGYSWMRIKIK